jgi:hypothetical protein
VGPRASLDTEATGKILCPRRGSNPDNFLLYTFKDTLDPVAIETVREPHAAKYDVNQNISD